MTGAPGIARAVRRRRKFSEAYRHTHVYAWRRVFKTARNFGLAVLEQIRADFPRLRRSEFPYKCHLCGHQIESADDRLEWHGLGNCVEICDDCLGTALDETQPDPEAAGLPCPACKGRGWFPMEPRDFRPALRFPDRPLIPRRDAEFGE